MKLKTFSLIILAFIQLKAFSQKDSLPYKKKYVGFNSNPMLSQIIPFNKVNNNFSEPTLMTRKIYGDKGVRFGLGINTDVVTLDIIGFGMQAGLITRKPLYNKFYWLTGVDFKMNFSNNTLNTTGTNTTLATDFVGIAPFWGVEYQLNKTISFSTESALLIGGDPSSNGSFRIALNPPISIFCHFYIPKK